MKKILYLALVLLLAGACAFHSGNLTNAAEGSNFIYKALAQGDAKTWALFGLGGINRDALVYEAKQKLFKNRPLKAGEAYANFTVDFKYSIILIYSETKVTVTADILEFKKDSPENRYGPYYPKAKPEIMEFYTSLFIPGDTVLGPELEHYQITGITDQGLVVRNLSNNDNLTDILDFDEVLFTAQDQSKLISRIKKQSHVSTDTNALFSVFDSVLVFDRLKESQVILKLDSTEALVMPIVNDNWLTNETFSITKLPTKDMFIKKPNFNGLALGDKFKINGESYTILFFGTERVIAKDNYGYSERVKYRKINP